VEPDWLTPDPTPPPEPVLPPQYPPPQPYEYQPQYPQQPQAQPARPGDAALEAFVDNPQAWLDQQLASREQQLVGPLQQQQQSIAFMMNTLINNNVEQGAARADASIRKAYDAFNKDATFRSNKAMQDKVGATLRGMKERAEYEARGGNFGPLNALANLSEADIAGTLAYVRAASGTGSPGIEPLQVEGATVETSRAPVAEQEVVLSDEQEAIAARMGKGYRARMVQAVRDQAKYNDFEMD
jgi:hypothetical protein